MINNVFKIKILLFAVVVLAGSCKKRSRAEAQGIPSLSFVESTMPSAGVSAAAGSIVLEVEWSYTTFSLKGDSVKEGVKFIQNITPSFAGEASSAGGRTKITLTCLNNSTYNTNRQTLELRSSDGNIRKYFDITQSPKKVDPVSVAISSSTTYQRISGFGGANMMWGTDNLTAGEIKSVFGTGDNELGLSIYRVRLSPVNTEWAGIVATVKEARSYGAAILASPWSPPAAMKNNNNVIGGHLLEGNYGAYATCMNDFVQYMASQNAPVDVVSVQNEPDIQVSYESCDWTAMQIFNFIKDHGHKIQGAKLAAAESFNFKQAYTDLILNDATASANLDIVAGHIYGGGLAAYPLAEQKGKEVWMTEYLLNQNSGSSQSNWNQSPAAIWAETMTMLGTVHDGMMKNWNAYVWWYIRRYYSFLGDGEQGTSRGEVLKRGYAFSHYSKFVRPGYIRISAIYSSDANVRLTAYKGDNRIVLVVINMENSTVPELNFTFDQNISSAEAYTTSVSQNRQRQALAPSGNTIKASLAPQSITTIVAVY